MNKLLKNILPIALILPALALPLVSTTTIETGVKEQIGSEKFVVNDDSIEYKGEKYTYTKIKNLIILTIKGKDYEIKSTATDEIYFYTINEIDYLFIKETKNFINLKTGTATTFEHDPTVWTMPNKTQYITVHQKTYCYFWKLESNIKIKIISTPSKINFIDEEVIEITYLQDYNLLNLKTQEIIVRNLKSTSNKKTIDGKIFYIQDNTYIPYENTKKLYNKTTTSNTNVWKYVNSQNDKDYNLHNQDFTQNIWNVQNHQFLKIDGIELLMVKNQQSETKFYDINLIQNKDYEMIGQDIIDDIKNTNLYKYNQDKIDQVKLGKYFNIKIDKVLLKVYFNTSSEMKFVDVNKGFTTDYLFHNSTNFIDDIKNTTSYKYNANKLEQEKITSFVNITVGTIKLKIKPDAKTNEAIIVKDDLSSTVDYKMMGTNIIDDIKNKTLYEYNSESKTLKRLWKYSNIKVGGVALKIENDNLNLYTIYTENGKKDDYKMMGTNIIDDIKNKTLYEYELNTNNEQKKLATYLEIIVDTVNLKVTHVSDILTIYNDKGKTSDYKIINEIIRDTINNIEYKYDENKEDQVKLASYVNITVGTVNLKIKTDAQTNEVTIVKNDFSSTEDYKIIEQNIHDKINKVWYTYDSKTQTIKLLVPWYKKKATIWGSVGSISSIALITALMLIIKKRKN